MLIVLQVFQKWLAAHGRTAASHFKDEQLRAAARNHPNLSSNTAAPAGDAGAHARRPSVLRANFENVQSAVVNKLIGGVGRAPIQLSSMPEPVDAAPEAEKWLEGVEVDEEAVEAMHEALEHAEQVCSLFCSGMYFAAE